MEGEEISVSKLITDPQVIIAVPERYYFSEVVIISDKLLTPSDPSSFQTKFMIYAVDDVSILTSLSQGLCNDLGTLPVGY